MRRQTRQLPWPLVLVTLLAGAGVAACQGCQTPPSPGGRVATKADEPAAERPTLRLYVTSTIAGALEPCGCTKDQLGGLPYLAAYLKSQNPGAEASLLVGAGPMLFGEPKLRSGDTSQERWKAEAIAGAFKDMALVAWAPGFNDWADGADRLNACADLAGAGLLAGNLVGSTARMSATLVRTAAGVKVGLVGVSDPKGPGGAYPEGVKETAALDAMRAGIADVVKQGATIVVGLAALPRGEALRIADSAPELHVLLVGKPVEMGDANDGPKAPVLAGSTLVVESANHAQTVGVVDLFVRKGAEGARLVFADAGGVARAEELLILGGRIRDLEARIGSWERERTVSHKDLAARTADLERLRAEKARMEASQPVVNGSFFRYKTVEVRDSFGSDRAVSATLASYYKRVNAHNKAAFADRVPAKVAAGQASYVGVEACTSCHEDARKFWNRTQHASAYATLQKDFKEYNLDCVGCHVTAYDKPGGSTVTANAKLQNVQCETCHGPGSLHVATPQKKGLIVRAPAPTVCIGCHHPPHVEGFNAAEKERFIVGPGHGKPL